MAPVTRQLKHIAPALESHEGIISRSELQSKSVSPSPRSETAEIASSNSSSNYPTRRNKCIEPASDSCAPKTVKHIARPAKSQSPTLSSRSSTSSSHKTRSTYLPRKKKFCSTPYIAPSSMQRPSSNAGSQTTPEVFTKTASEKSHSRLASHVPDAAGVITPALLAKHHLPGVLLNHGPLAIRHILGCLTTDVPGFAGISPTKARRLVVSALESRTNEYVVDNDGNDVFFEKVGWGRWHAKLRNQPAANGLSPSRLPKTRTKKHYKYDRTRLKSSYSSWPDHSAAYFSHGDPIDLDTDIVMTENDTDKLSFDEIENCSSPPSLEALHDDDDDDDDEVMSDDYGESSDTTDDEDWASLGAAALRAASYSTHSTNSKFLSSAACEYRGGGGPPLTALTKSYSKPNLISNIELSAFDLTSNPQEREAIEALLRLGSV